MNIYLIIFSTVASSIICTLTSISSIGNAVNNILGFSVGNGQLTILYGDNSGGIYVSSIYSYDVASNQSTLITNSVSISSLRFLGQKGKPSGVQYWYIFQNSQWLAIYTNDFSIYYTGFYGSGVISVFGANQVTVYLAVNKPLPACEYQVMSLMSPVMTATFYTITDYLCGDVVYNNNRIYFIASSTINTTIKVDIIDTFSDSLIKSLSFENQTGKFQIDIFQPYFVIAIGTKFTVYLVSDFAQVCQSTVPSQIIDIKLNSKWLFVSDLYNIYQFLNTNCMVFGTSPPTLLSVGSEIRIDESNINRCFYLQKSLSITSIGYLQAQDKYSCLGGCSSCISNYSLNENRDCQFIGQSGQPSYCLQSQNEVCQVFCDYKCETCVEFYDKCVACNFFRQMNSQQICQMPALKKLLIIAVNVVKTFRVKKNQNMFFLIDNFELYNYHKSPYDGMFRGILDMMGELDSLKWSFFPFDFILDWTKRPYRTERYNHFTNERFLQVEQINSLLFETLKSLYLISFSLILITFVILNRLFCCLKNFRVSFLIRTYSFFFEFVLILFISNSTKICFLSFHYFELLFSSSYVFKISHSLSILFSGVFLLLLLTFFFLSEFLYGKLSKYFLFNCYRVKNALLYNFILFSLRPLVQSSLHVFLYKDNAKQIMILGALQFVLLVYAVFLQLTKAIFKSKFTFLVEVCIAFCMLLMNLLLYFKHYVYNSESEKAILSVLQSGIESICYLIAGFVAISILQSYSSFLYFIGQDEESADICYQKKTSKKEESQKINQNKKMATNTIKHNEQATSNKSQQIVVDQYVAKDEKRKARKQNMRQKEEKRDKCRQKSQKMKNKAIRLFLTSHTIQQRKDGKAMRLHHLKFIGKYQ